MKRTFTILAFNALIVSTLFAPLTQSVLNFKPELAVLLFVIMAYAATIVIVSSYRVGRVIFSHESGKILSAGFFFSLIGFIFLTILMLGYLEYVKGYTSPVYIANSTILIVSFVILPMLAARKNTSLLKMISRVTRHF
jgi:hypothetical protein